MMSINTTSFSPHGPHQCMTCDGGDTHIDTYTHTHTHTHMKCMAGGQRLPFLCVRHCLHVAVHVHADASACLMTHRSAVCAEPKGPTRVRCHTGYEDTIVYGKDCQERLRVEGRRVVCKISYTIDIAALRLIDLSLAYHNNEAECPKH